MNGHLRYLELISASIDFPLDEEERAELNAHLARCPECRRMGAELRGQASAISSVPPPVLPPARAEKVLTSVLRHRASAPPVRLLAVAALLATLAGGVLAAGLGLFEPDVPQPTERPRPSEIAILSPEPSLDPGAEPTPEPGTPGVAPTSPPRSTPAPTRNPATVRLPVDWDADSTLVRMVPAAEGGLYAAISAEDRTIVIRLGTDGRPAKGWPIVLRDERSCDAHAADDGTLRLLCTHLLEGTVCADFCEEARLHAFDRRGRELKGWPVTLAGGFGSGIDPAGSRVIGTDLYVTAFESREGDDSEQDVASRWLLRIDAAGSIRSGAAVELTGACCLIGPDGVAYARTDHYADDGEHTTELVAFDTRGMRPGWPIYFSGAASLPAFRHDDRLAVTVAQGDGGVFISLLEPDGSLSGIESGTVNGEVDRNWDDFSPSSPLIDNEDRAYLAVDGRIVGFAANLAPLAGWPYEPPAGLAVWNMCGPGDTGCPTIVKPPMSGARGLVYLVESADGGRGERLIALNPSGRVRSGWPVTLTTRGAEFETVVVADDGVTYALAVEPERRGHSATILAIARDSTVIYTRTILDP